MSDSAVLKGPAETAIPYGSTAARGRITASSTHRIVDVRTAWREFTAHGIESPGQDYDFVRLWADTTGVAEDDRVFVMAELDNYPVAVLPLRRVRRFGVVMLTWFPGSHVGCNAPIADVAAMTAMTADERRAVWRRMAVELRGEGDLVYLPYVPELPYLAELGESIAADTLYRAEFTSWENANTTQRSKSRRKHDRQQGERLEALGAVSFEELTNDDNLAPVIETMFAQRAARFRAMGVSDPFADPHIRAFYLETAVPGSKTPVRMHVLRLDGEIVAVRYNIASRDRMFCLISSMSDDPRIQGGSPGKQCLLRVMQSIFDDGYRMFDMGAGFTDEKRHWCNVQIPVRQHYLPLSPIGGIAAMTHRSLWAARRRIKEDPRLMGFVKKVRSRLGKGRAPEKGDETE
jgi:CelD/BcsL family acetyltransferase involved in cellulose biosynthesis